MPSLSLSLFGSFQATLDGHSIAGFESNKVRALLAYLAVEADRPHSRDELIGLLWPDQPDATARANLRQALANLRNAVGDRTSETPFLSTTTDSVQFNRTDRCSIDVVQFTALSATCKTHVHRRLETCRSCAQRLQQAVDLYRGDFLAQFVQSGSEAFEEWTLIQRERLHRDALDALYHLTQHYEWRGDYGQALHYAQRQLELDSWREEAHRQLMYAFALTDQRSAALAQYETCRRVLSEEFGAEPSAETAALYEQIRAGTLASIQPQWLTPATPLIGREAELAEVNALWHNARMGKGQVLLISGEPGIGKTRLTHELIAQERYGSAYVLLSECYAEGSAPFASIAQVLQAALDSAGAAQSLNTLATSVIADLITYVPTLRDRFPDVAPNLPLEPQAEQQRRFDSVASFFTNLAARMPVMLIIEDAHWADSATLALLRHIARRLRRARVLIIATHRAVDPDETRLFHEWLSDLQRECVVTSINLARLDKDNTRDLLAEIFKEAITPEFLDGVYHATEGNPFFVTEVCQALIDEGAVYREGDGWQRRSMAQIQIPRSVRLAIQRRIDRLPETAQDTLQRAAVLGREFEFDVLQAMSDLNEEGLIDALELAERAQLIGEVARASHTARVAYTFVHALIPSTLHDGLSSLRRQRLHRRAAQVIEQMAQRANQVDDVAVQLAQHFTEAGEIDKAIEYWLKAGEHAQRVYAYDEAIAHYQQALALSKEQGVPGLTTAARTAMKLGTLYHTLFDFERAQPIFDEAFDLWERVREAQSQVRLSPAPHALRMYWYVREINTLDPTLCADVTGIFLINHLFTGLVDLTAGLDIIPALARAWEISQDGCRYVFHLRSDAFWSDGIPVTAGDFEHAWKRILQPDTASPHTQSFFDIKGAQAFHEGRLQANDVGVTALDDRMLVVELGKATGHFLYGLAMTRAYAIPRHVVETHGETWSTPGTIVTNGPFSLSSWMKDESMALVRNPDYRGLFNGNLSRIELTSLPREANVDLLDQYKLDLHDISELHRDQLQQTRRFASYAREYASRPMASVGFIAFDASRPPFNDARVRRAFVHVIDRPALVAAVDRGENILATGGFIPPDLPAHTPNIGLAYDPQRAKRLLAEAGYPNGRGFPPINACTRYEQYEDELAVQWCNQLGLEITWETIDYAAYSRFLADRPPHLFALGLWASQPDPLDWLSVLVNRYTHWHDIRYQQLIETARHLPNQIERLKLYQAADRLLIEEAVVMPISYLRRHMLIKPWVKHFPSSPVRHHYWQNVIIEPH
jgi:ABC-type oligopeptide transport system substrate-binding subunit/DNA-binding SARP family transcriptional activator